MWGGRVREEGGRKGKGGDWVGNMAKVCCVQVENYDYKTHYTKKLIYASKSFINACNVAWVSGLNCSNDDIIWNKSSGSKI